MDTSRVVYQAVRADEGEELAASSDNWFRPVNFVNAPDGSLYVLDMYRETIEHPYSIPAEIKKFLDLTSGWNRGRIYRLVSPKMKRHTVVPIGSLNSQDLVAELASPNGWNRETAQRVIWERQDKELVPLIEKLLKPSTPALGRLHALVTLQGLHSLSKNHVLMGLADEHPRVRAHAVRLSEPFLDESPEVLDKLLRLTSDGNEHVRFQLAFSLGESKDAKAGAALARLARHPGNSREVTTALLSSVAVHADSMAVSLLRDPKVAGEPASLRLLRELALIIGANPDPQGAMRFLSASIDAKQSLRDPMLKSLEVGLSRRGSSIGKLLAEKDVPSPLRRKLQSTFETAATQAANSKLSSSERIVAIRLLAYADWKLAGSVLPEFLSPTTPQALQKA